MNDTRKRVITRIICLLSIVFLLLFIFILSKRNVTSVKPVEERPLIEIELDWTYVGVFADFDLRYKDTIITKDSVPSYITFYFKVKNNGDQPLCFGTDHDGNRTYNGYEWIPEEDSYNDDGSLKRGLYAQAIFFSDNGTFDSSSKYNIDSSTATVCWADGTTQAFDANTNPSSSDYATVPEGTYHATVGSHKGQYTALRMSDTNNSGQIELGSPNPAHPVRTYAEGVNIHLLGKNNFTGVDSKGNPVSAGCFY